jgi:DNA recombination protein RmuC
MSTPIIFLVCAAVFTAGLLVGYLFAARRSREAENKSATNASAAIELRLQIETLRRDVEASRAKLEQETARRAAAESNLESQRANLEEQRKLLEQAEVNLRDAFQALASNALKSNSQQFLDLAKTVFGSLQTEATGDLATRQVAIEGLVDPLREAVEKLEEHLSQTEASNQVLLSTTRELKNETGSLVSSLRQPHIKGRWGEMTLRRVAELAGMSLHCDFDLQVSTETDEGRMRRPDMVVHLAGGGNIVVDSKVPSGLLDVASAPTEDARREALAEHARLVKSHVNQLSSKEYWKEFEPLKLVVLFLPGESLFSAALEQDPDILQFALEKNIVLASPASLFAILRSIAAGWQREQVAKNAHEISELGRELYDRISRFVEHMQGIHAGLQKANDAFDKASRSLETRVLTTARRFKERGIQTSSEISEIDSIEASLPLLDVPTPEDDKQSSDFKDEI